MMKIMRNADDIVRSLRNISEWQNHAILSYDKAERENTAQKWSKNLRENTEELIQWNTPEERAEICAVLREVEDDLLKVVRDN